MVAVRAEHPRRPPQLECWPGPLPGPCDARLRRAIPPTFTQLVPSGGGQARRVLLAPRPARRAFCFPPGPWIRACMHQLAGARIRGPTAHTSVDDPSNLSANDLHVAYGLLPARPLPHPHPPLICLASFYPPSRKKLPFALMPRTRAPAVSFHVTK